MDMAIDVILVVGMIVGVVALAAVFWKLSTDSL